MTDAAYAPAAVCIAGGPASGKTTALIERACAFFEREPGQTRPVPGTTSPLPAGLFFCATPHCASAARALLRERGLGHVEVATPFDYALRILADPRAAALTGRKPRILDEADEAVFFEDMKTSGIKKRRLREILAFLARGLADLRDDDPGWIQTTEEEALIELAREVLAFTNGMLRCEVSNLAVRVVRQCDDLRKSYSAPIVLADDCHLLSRASQTLAALLARDALIVSTDAIPARSARSANSMSPALAEEAPAFRTGAACAHAAFALPAGEPYPNPAGAFELAAAHPCTEHLALHACHRPLPIAETVRHLHAMRTRQQPVRRSSPALQTSPAAQNASATEGGPTAPETSLELDGECTSMPVDHSPAAPATSSRLAWRCAPTLSGELALVTVTVSAALADGTPPERICVVGVNAAWRANVARALHTHGIPVRQTTAVTPRTLDSAPRRVTERDRQETLARIASNPSDSLAWRRWCGFDDYLARSTAIAELRTRALPHGLSLAEALDRLGRGALADLPADHPLMTGLRTCWQRAHAAMRQDKSSKPAGPPQSAEACAVCVSAPADVYGRTFDLVVFGGFVNGLIPSRDFCDPGALVGGARERARQADLAAIERVVSRATDRLVFTGFASCSLEAAEQLKLHISRIRLKDGVRTCTIEPSLYLKQIAKLLVGLEKHWLKPSCPARNQPAFPSRPYSEKS